MKETVQDIEIREEERNEETICWALLELQSLAE
jgi:hypothetical protein